MGSAVSSRLSDFSFYAAYDKSTLILWDYDMVSIYDDEDFCYEDTYPLVTNTRTWTL